jgi:hypothetical protein
MQTEAVNQGACMFMSGITTVRYLMKSLFSNLKGFHQGQLIETFRLRTNTDAGTAQTLKKHKMLDTAQFIMTHYCKSLERLSEVFQVHGSTLAIAQLLFGQLESVTLKKYLPLCMNRR